MMMPYFVPLCLNRKCQISKFTVQPQGWGFIRYWSEDDDDDDNDGDDHAFDDDHEGDDCKSEDNDGNDGDDDQR